MSNAFLRNAIEDREIFYLYKGVNYSFREKSDRSKIEITAILVIILLSCL